MRLLPLALLAGCGTSSNPGAACDPTADACQGQAICLVDTCAAAFPLPYRAFSVHVTTPDAHDLQVVFAVGTRGDPAQIVASSPIAADQTDAMFDGPFPFDLGDAMDALLVETLDAATGTMLFACARSPVDLGRLRQRDDNCDQGGFSISYEIEPAVLSADGRR